MSRVNDLAANSEKFLVEIHMLKNFPTSHLNADDTGSLKEMQFGGVPRARISSQCLKNAWRKSEIIEAYSNNLYPEKAYRTRKVADLVCSRLSKEYGFNDDESVRKVIANFVGKDSGVMCFLSSEEINAIADALYKTGEDITEIAQDIEKIKKGGKGCAEEKERVKKYEKAVQKSIDEYIKKVGHKVPAIISLFGRMSTSGLFSTIDSSVQVAHAISTHAIVQDSDYFTAVDDIVSESGETGSGHLDETSFNSACYYMYFGWDINQFCRNLENNCDDEEYKEKALETAASAILKTVCMDSPKTKKGSFACATYPSAVYVVVKKVCLPSVMANAFEKPVVRSQGNTIVEASIKALVAEIDKTQEAYPVEIAGSFWLAPGSTESVQNATTVKSLTEIIEKVEEIIK